MLNISDIAVRFIVYGSIHLLTDYFLTIVFDNKTIKQLNKADRIDLGEKMSSTVNGIITGGLAIHIMFYEKSFSGDVYSPYNQTMDLFFTNLVAYSLYDIVVMYMKPREEPSIWIHHICSLIGACLTPIYKIGTFFPIIFGITELTVITNNFVWYLQRLQFKNTELYENSLFLRALLFTLIRPFLGIFAIYYAIQNPGPLPINSVIQNLSFFEKASISWTNFSNMPLIASVLIGTFALMLTLLNIAWTYVILTNYFKKTKTRID